MGASVAARGNPGAAPGYNVYGPGRIYRYDETASSASFYLPDGLGATTALTDDTGAVTDTYEYDGFGNIRTETGSSANEFTFTGEQVDSTDLQYLRARYYDPAVGRFLSEDPLPLMQRYAYAGNNPVNHIDPYGLIGFGDIVDAVVPDPVGECLSDPLACGQDVVDTVGDAAEGLGGSIRDGVHVALPYVSTGDLDPVFRTACFLRHHAASVAAVYSRS